MVSYKKFSARPAQLLIQFQSEKSGMVDLKNTLIIFIPNDQNVNPSGAETGIVWAH